ncbi:MAG: DsbA family protein [Gemmatimonadaceae bacterium]
MTVDREGSTLSIPVSVKDHVEGPASAKVTLVEYGDYQCPYCGSAHAIVKKIQKEMGKELRFVFRNFPLAQAHAHATHAAIAAEVAGEKGEQEFWAMHDTLYENHRALEDDDLVGYAESRGVTSGELEAAYAGGAAADHVRADFRGGVRSGVNGTPTFFVNGERYDGDWKDVPSFVSALRAAAKS